MINIKYKIEKEFDDNGDIINMSVVTNTTKGFYEEIEEDEEGNPIYSDELTITSQNTHIDNVLEEINHYPENIKLEIITFKNKK